MSLLQGKIAWVTGAGRGIGKAIALRLARAGSDLAICSRTVSELHEVAQEIEKMGRKVFYQSVDVAQSQALIQFHESAVQALGPIDILVNNAGGGGFGFIAQTEIQEWDQAIATNLRATMIGSKLVLASMIERNGGAIINMSSVLGKMGAKGAGAYSAAKFGVIGFSQCLFEEVREFNIKVCVICPGYVDTPLIPDFLGLAREKMIDPEEIAAVVESLVSDFTRGCPVEVVIRPQLSPGA
ncbi:MAG: SDR family oxidoreductase [Deltaproteobacteria bacterium]|nr:SDR family oxidoreductase [Deltaproteobacteria bacterium]